MAQALAEAGARTVIVGRDRTRSGSAALERLRADGGELAFEPCDATSRDELRDLVARVLASHGRIDVLVNGAGVNSATPFLEISDEELERVVAVNQLAVVRACQEFGRYFVERARSTGEGASIVNVGSVSGLTPLSRVFTYSMTKAAVHNLTKNLAREWGPLGIRCNVLVPGVLPGRAEPGDPDSRAGRGDRRPHAARALRRASTTWRGRRCCSPPTPGGSSPAPSSSSTAASAR